MSMVARKSKFISPSGFWIVLLLLCSLGRGSALSICVPTMARYVIVFAVIIICIFAIKDKGKVKISWLKKNPHAIVFLCLLIPSMLINHGNSNDLANVVLIVTVLIAYLISIHTTKDNLIEYYITTIYILCLISLGCFLLFNLLNVPSDWMIHMYKQSDITEGYKTIGIYSIRIKDSLRNCGLFWEPSIFAAYIAFALFFQLFFSNNHSKKTSAVFIISIISTLSTGGMVLLFLIVVIWFWRNRKGGVMAKIGTIVIAAMMIFIWEYLTDWLLSLNYGMFSKIVFFRESKSSMSRIYSILINLEIWKTSPIFGVGLAQVETMYNSTNASRLAVSLLQMFPSQSATPFIFLSSFGVLGAYYSYMWIKACIGIQVFNSIQKIIFGIFVFFVLTETPHTQFILTFFIVFTLLHKNNYYTNNETITMEETKYECI